MNLESFGDAGIVGILVVIILREVKRIIDAKIPMLGGGGGEESPDCDEAKDQLDRLEIKTDALVASATTLNELVAAKDPAGLPLIYRDSQAVSRLNTNIEALHRSIERLGDRLERPA
jgi:hypothetical protein